MTEKADNTEKRIAVEADRRVFESVTREAIKGLQAGQDRMMETIEGIRDGVTDLSKSLAVHKAQTGLVAFFVTAIVSAITIGIQLLIKGH